MSITSEEELKGLQAGGGAEVLAKVLAEHG